MLDFSEMLNEGAPSVESASVGPVADEVVVEAQFSCPAVVGPFDLETVKPKFRDLVAGVDAMVSQAQKMMVNTADEERTASALGIDAKRIYKLIEAKREETIAPYSEFILSVNNFCSLFTEKLVTVRKTVKGNKVIANPGCIEEVLESKILTYRAQVELERRKKEEAARKAKEELQARLNAEAAEANRKAEEEARQKAIAEAQAVGAGAVEIAEKVEAALAAAKENAIEAPTVPDLIVPQNSAPVRTENGGVAYGAKRWVCVIVDPALVPREFCAPVQKLLNDAVKQGVRSIPGCEIKEEQGLRFRS